MFAAEANNGMLAVEPQLTAISEFHLIPELDVIRAAVAGLDEAFAFLYQRHKRKVYSTCLRIVGDTSEAEDLTQEVFLLVHRRLATFRGDARFSTWLHQVTVNVSLAHLRNRRSRSAWIDTVGEDNNLDEISSRDGTLVRSVDRVALERAMKQLPPGYKLIFILHDVLGYPHSQISKKLGCTEGNCKSQIHKARIKLRRLLITGDLVSSPSRQFPPSKDLLRCPNRNGT
jgi:RNA polymerase sigma-70 factor, ECF subfamily